MKPSGAIFLAVCGLGFAGGAWATEPTTAIVGESPRMSAFNRRMANVSGARIPTTARAVKFQASLAAAQTAEAKRSAAEGVAQARLNRFVSRSDRPESSIRPAASLTPAAHRAALQR